ncbi:MAG: DNA polymerase III subunit delta' [Bacillota bacterium]
MPWRIGPGQEMPFKLLTAALAKGQVAHAYLFSGPGTGLARAGLELARALNCLDGPGEPCGHCLRCRRIEQGNMPDVGVIRPDQGTMRLTQVRQVQRALAMISHESRYKVWVMDQADTMSLEAANSLLKVLEEPPANSVLILTTANPGALPPTVLSRCQVIRFAAPSYQEIVDDLLRQGLSPEDASLAARLCDGEVHGLVELAQSNSLVGLLQRVVDDIAGLSGHDPLELGAAWDGLGKDLLGVCLDLGTLALRDAYLTACGLTVGERGIAQASKLAPMGPDCLEECILAMLRTKDYVESHVNARLALEVMFLELKEVIHSCQL